MFISIDNPVDPMPMYDNWSFECMVCGTKHTQGFRSMESPMKCKGCRGYICSTCQKTEESVKNDKCPSCGGKLYFPI